jgi:hypothetical protein
LQWIAKVYGGTLDPLPEKAEGSPISSININMIYGNLRGEYFQP